jgi:protein-S-isoprenylcysteine O-methyltransferase Ste14
VSAFHQHFGDWASVVGWILIFGVFLAFLPFQRRSPWRPANIYLAFIVASAFEMFGIPLSMYFVAWAFGVTLPEGLLWGHTLQQYIGYFGMYLGFLLNVVGGALIVLGWRAIYRSYWGAGERKLVIDGVYAHIRHPQYIGIILMTLGLLIHWATIPLLIMWPMLIVQYYRLARREEEELEREFGEDYTRYREKVPMFIPFLKWNKRNSIRPLMNLLRDLVKRSRF